MKRVLPLLLLAAGVTATWIGCSTAPVIMVKLGVPNMV
jgi:hypothetical protein